MATTFDQSHSYFLTKLQEHGMTQHNLASTREMNVLDLVISNVPDQVSDISLANPISTSDHDTLCFNTELPAMDGRNACNDYFIKYAQL